MKKALLILASLLIFTTSAYGQLFGRGSEVEINRLDQILLPIVWDWTTMAAQDTIETEFVNISGYSVLAVVAQLDTVSGAAGGTTDSSHVKIQYQTGEILTKFRDTIHSLNELSSWGRLEAISSSDTTVVKNAGTEWNDILTDVGFGADRGAIYPVPCTWLKMRAIGLSTNGSTHTKYKLWLLLAPL